jgi:hypothetical protein
MLNARFYGSFMMSAVKKEGEKSKTREKMG